MTIKTLIKTEKQYQEALKRLEKIFDAKINTPEGDELALLSLLIDEYENKYFSIKGLDPIEAIKFRMDQMNLSISELGDILGYKSRASEILHRKRKLSLTMIRNIVKKLHIPSSVLIQQY